MHATAAALSGIYIYGGRTSSLAAGSDAKRFRGGAKLHFQPVTLGQRLRTGDFGWFTITEAVHPPNLVLEPHAHRYPAITMVRRGSFGLHIGRRKFECSNMGVFFKQGDLEHANEFGSHGAHSLIIELRSERAAELESGPGLPRCSYLDDHPWSVRLAAEIEREFALESRLAATAIESLILEILASPLGSSRVAIERRPPGWFHCVNELIHEHFKFNIEVRRLAEEAGVHPIHLARVFRQFYRCSVGEYVRRLRVNYSAAELRNTDAPLATIAVRAGFYDQAHLSRWFKRHMDATPGRYRAAFRRRRRNRHDD